MMRVRNKVISGIMAIALQGSLYAESHEAKCLNTFLDHVGVSLGMESNPTMMQDVVDNEFYFKNFPEGRNLVKSYLNKPQKLHPFLSKVHQAILNRHPAMVKAICQINEDHLVPKLARPQRQLIHRTIHNMVVLEALVQKMKVDVHFMDRIKTHYLSERHKILPENSSLWTTYRAAGGVFEAAKLLTMDEVFVQYYHFRLKDTLDEEDLHTKNVGLQLNISEATIADEVKRNWDNAFAGRTLLANKILGIEKVGDKNSLLKQYFIPHWSPLYETWNLAFVLGSLNNLNIILPKLLIPSVIDAQEEDYLFYRGISLWITINLHLLHTLHKKPTVEFPSEIRKPLVALWGTINREYAESVASNTPRFVLPTLMGLGMDFLKQ